MGRGGEEETVIPGIINWSLSLWLTCPALIATSKFKGTVSPVGPPAVFSSISLTYVTQKLFS
jgi:hypothetical protein